MWLWRHVQKWPRSLIHDSSDNGLAPKPGIAQLPSEWVPTSMFGVNLMASHQRGTLDSQVPIASFTETGF